MVNGKMVNNNMVNYRHFDRTRMELKMVNYFGKSVLKSTEHCCRYELVDWAGFEPATSRSFGGHTVIASTHTRLRSEHYYR
jgi:hypothetical protein